MTRVALYARYSTDLQSAASAEDQHRVCRTLAAREGWTIVAEFADAAMSGATRDRPGLNALLARAAEFDLVLTESLDRLSRDQEDIAGIYKRLHFARCGIHTLADGRIGPLHIGMKGTMSAMFLTDLGDKTRRGQLGRIAAGRMPGGLSYGYRKVLALDARGEPERGLRSIDPHQADVVRWIFAEYAAGRNARTIATALNARGEPSPSGRQWNASTINGSRQAANGILQNPLYIGKLLFNRRRFERDPETRKRVSRVNAVADRAEHDVPELRIVDETLWAAVAARREAVAHAPAHQQRRPKRLFSGMIRCGECGGPIVIVGTDSWGCTRRRERGVCSNNRTIMTAPLERRLIAAIRDQLLHPEAVAAYVAEYHRAMAAIAKNRHVDRRALEAAHDAADARCKRLAEAIATGAADFADVRDLMARASQDRTAAAAAIAAYRPEQVVKLHPGAADRFRRQVEQLAALLATDEAAVEELRELLRQCIGAIVATPAEGRGLALSIEATLAPTLKQNRPRQNAEADPMSLVVAGTGFEPVTFRL